MKPLLALDLDGVLYDTIDMVICFMRNRFDVPLRRQDCRSANLASFIGTATPVVGEARVRQACDGLWAAIKHDNLFYSDMKPMPGAQQSVHRLAEIYRLQCITSRPIGVRHGTTMAMARDFPEIVHDTKQRIPAVHHTSDKVKLALANRVHIFVEDSAETVRALLKKPQLQVFHINHYGDAVRPSRRLFTVGSIVEATDTLVGWGDRFREMG